VPSLIFNRQLTVEWGQCDPAGTVFNSRFFEMFDTNTWLLFQSALAVKPQDMAETFGLLGIPIVDARAEFVKPIRFGDDIEIMSRVREFRRSSFDVEHRISVGGELAVDGGETRVWTEIDNNNPQKIRAMAIPPDVIARFG
jgi:4-hydroxybenzoyl-CoA thioesterase